MNKSKIIFWLIVYKAYRVFAKYPLESLCTVAGFVLSTILAYQKITGTLAVIGWPVILGLYFALPIIFSFFAYLAILAAFGLGDLICDLYKAIRDA